MDSSIFDDMVRAVSHRNTRRGALGALAGGLLAVIAPLTGEAKPKRRKKKGQRPKSCPERCGGRCVARCPDVMTRNQTTCQCECPDEMNKCGQVCVGADRCCPGEKSCGGGCIREQDCCPHTEKWCPTGVCIPKDACCPIVEEACGAECCVLGEECCNGVCGGTFSEICTKDGWCPQVGAQACCAGSIQDCGDSPCCDFSAGEACCVSSLDPVETTCCPGGPGQCAPGGCCPAGTEYKGDCEACCTNGTTACTSCRSPVAGRG
jgi:hypothetical protein